MEQLRQRIFKFINSPKGYPVLSGLSVGIYMLLYYYAANTGLAWSAPQIVFFALYYIGLSIFLVWDTYKIFSIKKFTKYRSHAMFVIIPGLLAFFLLQLAPLGPVKRLYFVALVILFLLLSLKLARYYKFFIVLLLVMAACNIPKLASTLIVHFSASQQWRELPDGIVKSKFVKKPNIYYIQPDGYTSPDCMKDTNYNFDNSEFNNYLTNTGFTLYNDFRSNYASTLLSNAATFSMKHHCADKDVLEFTARNIIMGGNPVLETLKNNGYRTVFVTEKPYLMVNRPAVDYDVTNFSQRELPFIKDALGTEKNVLQSFKEAFKKQGSNFYFIEKFKPSHIGLYNTQGVEGERRAYLDRVKEANVWLKEIIGFITDNDPDGIIVIGADHGGYVGLANLEDCSYQVKDPVVVKGMFGALMAIKWNGTNHTYYDGALRTPVNLFRTIFSYLSADKNYLKHSEADESYDFLEHPKGIYKYIDHSGKIVFQKQK